MRTVQLLHARNPLQVILDASPVQSGQGRVPGWFVDLIGWQESHISAPIMVGGVSYAVLQVSPSLAGMYVQLWQRVMDVMEILLLLLLVQMLLLAVVLHYGLRPLELLSRTAEQLGRGDLTARMRPTLFKELAVAGQALNHMADNLLQLFDALRDKDRANQSLAAMVEQSGEIILSLDQQGIVRSWNNGAVNTLGWEERVARGKHLSWLIEGDAEAVPLMAEAILATQPPSQMECRLRRIGGGSIDVAVAASLLHEPDGQLAGYVLLARDMTLRRQTEQELRHAKELAEEASQSKSAFLATMSHELRTPMNGVIGVIELVLSTELTAQQRNYLEIVSSSANGLLRVLNDILDFSRLEAGGMKFEPVALVLADEIRDLLGLYASEAEAKGLMFELKLAENLPAEVMLDPLALQQILVNLVGNAVKFTHDGFVAVVAEWLSGTQMLRLTVSDSGIGIAAERLGQIFDPFTQADSSTTRQFGGTGLGLAIVHRVVSELGGRVRVQSQVGMGSRFVVELPAPLVSQGAELGLL